VAGDDLALRLADLAEVGLMLIGDDDVIRAANDAARRFLRRTTDLRGRTVLEAFLDHRVSEMVDGARKTGSGHREIRMGGEPQRTLLLYATRAETAAATWLIIRDVSELRRLQRIRTEFIDNLSHELRTPLTNVRLLAETLSMEIESDPVSARVRDSISRIDAETEHLSQIVTELLDLARIEQGVMDMRRDPIDLAEIVGSVSTRLEPFASRHGVRIRNELPPSREERSVVGDHERLEQLLVNLVHNAIKFSPPDAEAEVSISVGPDRVDPDHFVLLEVKDDGPGIPRYALQRVFERFYKVDRARTRTGQSGTGLGLAIARHVTEAHGGRIWVESQEGEGAHFFVALPRV
jgi:two-component system, OmpR family, phosphate regulon sensor histidine kinase PhoR